MKGASDLGLQCLPMSHKKDTRHIWVNSDFGDIENAISNNFIII